MQPEQRFDQLFLIYIEMCAGPGLGFSYNPCMDNPICRVYVGDMRA
jgi:hypothetical protein